jgi:signal transduction histidine kinase
MTAHATSLRGTTEPAKTRQALPPLGFQAIAMLVVGSAAAVIAAVAFDTRIPTRWLGMVLAASLVLAGVSMLRAVKEMVPEESAAWRPVAYGVLAAAIGQAVWSTLGGVVSLGGVISVTTDIASVAFFVLMSLGLVRMPYVSSSRAGTLRIAMDVVVGMVASVTLLWWVQDGVFDDGLVAPLLHIVLLGAMLTALLRRSPYVFDPRLALLSLGLLPPILIPELGPSGASSSAVMWSVTVICFGLLSVQLRKPTASQNVVVAKPGRGLLIVPYAPVVGVAALFTLIVVTGNDVSSGVLTWGILVVLVGIVARSWFAGRENRQLIAIERDQLLASITHDLRTPLTVVSGFSEVLGTSWDTLSDVERQKMVGLMRSGSSSLVNIIGDMESLARSELHTVPLDLERIEGKRVIADAIKLVFDIDRPLPIRAEVEPYLEVICDRRRLVQVLSALLENAVRYGSGKMLVVAKRSKTGRVIEVHDNGPGVAPRYEKVIWKRFERGENALNANVPGSGLGLAVVHSLVRAHGGETSYRRSERLDGACFVIELPYDSDLVLPRAEAT